MSTAPIQTRRWSRVEYEQLIDTGVFQPGERLELINGDLIVAEPQGSLHATAIELALDALRAAFGPGWRVRVQLPIALDEESEPEPDLAVVPGSPRDYRDTHPTRPALLVEVAEGSLAYDRRYKGSLYARAGVADYWILNLMTHVLEVRRHPIRKPSAPYGWHYRAVRVLGPSSFVSALASPEARIQVADLLP